MVLSGTELEVVQVGFIAHLKSQTSHKIVSEVTTLLMLGCYDLMTSAPQHFLTRADTKVWWLLCRR